jgi:uncharacterized protein YjbI with pentapeptide repeats
MAQKAKSTSENNQTVSSKFASSLRRTSNRPLVKAFAKVGEIAGKMAVFAAIVSWLVEIPSRRQQAYDSAWTLINSAQLKTGDSGRSNALQVLADGKQTLAFIDLSNAVLRNINLRSADLFHAKFIGAELQNVNMDCRWSFTKQPCTDLSLADFTRANLLNVDFSGASIGHASFIDNLNIIGVKMKNAYLFDTNFLHASMHFIDFENAVLQSVEFKSFILDPSPEQFRGASLSSVKFTDGVIQTSLFSLVHGACDVILPDGQKFDYRCSGRPNATLTDEMIHPNQQQQTLPEGSTK